MPLKFGDIEITDVIFNDTPIERVEYNGVVVFEKSSFPWMHRKNGVTTQDGKATVTFEDLDTNLFNYAAANFVVQPISCSSTAQTAVSVSFDVASKTVTVSLSPASSSLTFDLISLPFSPVTAAVNTTAGEQEVAGTYARDVTFFNCTQFNGTAAFEYAVEETMAKVTATGLTSLVGNFYSIAALNMDGQTALGPYYGWYDPDQGGRHSLDGDRYYFCPADGQVTASNSGLFSNYLYLYVNNVLRASGENSAGPAMFNKGDILRLVWYYSNDKSPGNYTVYLTPSKTS